MVPIFQLFSLVWLLGDACCCAAVARRWQTGLSSRSSDRVSDGVGRQPMGMRAVCENAAHVECLAKNTEVFDDFHEKGVARVECLAENTRNLDALHANGAAHVERLVLTWFDLLGP